MALLASGSADVVVLSIGAGGAPQCAAALDLPGEAPTPGALFSRGLVAVGPDRVLAATSAGLFALAVGDGCPPALEVDPRFDGSSFVGPIAQVF